MYLLWYAARSVSRYILFCPSIGESMFQHSVLRFHGISFKVFLLKPRRSIGRTRKVPYPVQRPGCLTAGTLVSTIRCDAPFRSSLFLQHCCIFRIPCSAVLTILAGRIWFSFFEVVICSYSCTRLAATAATFARILLCTAIRASRFQHAV